MHRYTPSKEQLRREWMRRMRRGARESRGPDIPDNSEPWFSDPPRTVREMIMIADKVAELDAQWGPRSSNS